PEPMSIAETSDGIAALGAAGIQVGDILVNRVLPAIDPCSLCDARRKEQRRAIDLLCRTFRRQRIRLLPDAPREPRGLVALRKLRENSVEREGLSRSKARAPNGRSAEAFALHRAGKRAKPDAAEVVESASIIFVGGKGGVGKTTVAAAIALELSRTL